jgi:hypothetical protein
VTWALINIVYYYPKPEYIETLCSNDIILNFYIIQLDRCKQGGYEDLVNNVVLLIGNLMYKRKDKIILMRDHNIIKRIAQCEKEEGSDRISHHSIWTLAEVFSERYISFEIEQVNLKFNKLSCAVDCFAGYISKYNDKKVLTNAFRGMCYLFEREDFKDKAIAKASKYNVSKKILSLDLLFQRETVFPAINLIHLIVSNDYNESEVSINLFT